MKKPITHAPATAVKPILAAKKNNGRSTTIQITTLPIARRLRPLATMAVSTSEYQTRKGNTKQNNENTHVESVQRVPSSSGSTVGASAARPQKTGNASVAANDCNWMKPRRQAASSSCFAAKAGSETWLTISAMRSRNVCERFFATMYEPVAPAPTLRATTNLSASSTMNQMNRCPNNNLPDCR